MFTASDVAHSLPVPSGVPSANPAFVSGRRRAQRALPEGRSPPLRRGLEQSNQLFPAGAPLQGAVFAAQNIPEASLERLVPFVDFLAECPKVSQWVLHSIEKGYDIRSRPPRFSGVLPTVVGPEQALVMGQEVKTLLQKKLGLRLNAKKSVLSPSQRTSFWGQPQNK